MPIRTNRGRAAVYRRLWGWPMRSPRHLIATVLVIAAVVIAIGLIVPRLTGSDEPAGGGAANLGGSSAPAAPTDGAAAGPTGAGQPTAAQPGQGSDAAQPTREPTPTLTPTSGPAPPEALDVATAWGKAFVNHPAGISNEQWLNGLRPYTTEERIAVMTSVDPANVPATEVTGPAVTVANYASSVTAAVPTNGGTITLSIIQTPQGWRVAEYEQAGY
jgi:hypothetical protein